jgi:hypothetical protein
MKLSPARFFSIHLFFNYFLMRTIRWSYTIILFVLFISTILVSCKKSDSTTVTQAPGPIITGTGTAVGAASDTLIGPLGGTLHSADGKLIVTIPAGAVASATTIAIQPVTNMAPLGLGNGYRLQPEGMTFANPVLLTFKYDDQLLQNSPEDFLWIITQAGDGSWNALMKSALDKNSKTVTITTTHFSDWALGRFIDLTVTPVAGIVKINQSIGLRVTGFSRDKALPVDDELQPLVYLTGDGEDLAPLAPFESLLMDFKVKQWTLNGSPAPVSNSNGSLTASGNGAIYTAPGSVPVTNPEAVTVQLEASKTTGGSMSFMVTSNITVVANEFFLHLTIDGHPYDYTQYGFNTEVPPDPDNFTQLICAVTDGKFEMMGSLLSTTAPVKNIFVLNIMNPSQTTKTLVGSNNNGNDDLSFNADPTGTSGFELNYQQRTPNAGNCDRVYLCGNATATLVTYSVTDMLVAGHFSGTIYEDNQGLFDNCTTPIPHHIEGEFRMMRSE